MKVVGLTGGIGAGKSSVARIFKSLGIPVYDSDSRAKELYSESRELRDKMRSHFGLEVYSGIEINRSFLANIVFKNPEELRVLNSFVHPLVQKDFECWTFLQKSRYVIREAAILIESDGYKLCDEVINVIAPMEVRLHRVMIRDEVSKEAVLSRIQSQISEEVRSSFSSFIIENDGKHSVIEQVIQIHNAILS